MNVQFLLALPRSVKKLFFVILDIAMLFFVYWFSLSLKPGYTNEWQRSDNWLLFILSATLTIGLFIKLGLYRAVTRYVGVMVVSTALVGSVASALMLVAINSILEKPFIELVSMVYFLLLFVLITGSRFIVRALLSGYEHHDPRNQIPVLIYGAGQSGGQLLESIRQAGQYRVVGLVDDNPALQRATVSGKTVYRPSEIGALVQQYRVRKILLAMPSVGKSARAKIIKRLEQFPCQVLSIPAMRELVDGNIGIHSLKKISVEDLLGREAVAPQEDLMMKDIAGKCVMVTGAGGSIGAELCRQIIRRRPAKLVLFELSEFSLYKIEHELKEFQTASGIHGEILPILGSVQHQKRLLSVMQTFGVQTIYHAAAYKHVPMVELNTIEGVRNNLFGTLFCAQAAIEARVETFVLISTDKAVRPTNTMGASKRMAELVLQALAAENHHHTRFCMVRFGNVLGSSGSVVPVFERQIETGGPVTLTHPEITRYFMTIPEAAQLVIQAGAMGKGGDVFVLDMGESVKIIDLARQMIRLSGLSLKDENHPNGDIEIQITGLRPGEKLYEELLIGENVSETSHPRIMTANEIMLPWAQLEEVLNQINQACKEGSQEKIRRLLLDAPTEFQPSNDIYDLVWLAHRKQFKSYFRQ